MAKFLKKLFKSEPKPLSEEERAQAIEDTMYKLKADKDTYIDGYMNSQKAVAIDKTSEIDSLNEMLIKPKGSEGYMSDFYRYEYLSALMDSECFRESAATWLVDNKSSVAKINVQCYGETVGTGFKTIDADGGPLKPIREYDTDTLQITLQRNDKGTFDIMSMGPNLNVPSAEQTGRDISGLVEKCPYSQTDKVGEKTLLTVRTNLGTTLGVSYDPKEDSVKLVQSMKDANGDVKLAYMLQTSSDKESAQICRKGNDGFEPVGANLSEALGQVRKDGYYQFARNAEVINECSQKVHASMQVSDKTMTVPDKPHSIHPEIMKALSSGSEMTNDKVETIDITYG